MNSRKQSVNKRKIVFLVALSIIAVIIYEFVLIDMRFFEFALRIRTPKLLVMMLAAFCIGSASIVFQSLINNTVVTPCLLGMNALYILIHTATVFVLGSASEFVTNKFLSFGIDMLIMGIVAMLIYGVLFKKTKGNVLYILLAGTVLATLFGSITSTLQRVMDPNEFDTLQNSLIASFHKVNGSILFAAVGLVTIIIVVLHRELALLNVITLGKEQAINLGVDYDKVVNKLLIGVTLFIAIATAVVGPISFLGLVIANLSRQLFKTFHHGYLIIGTVLIGTVTLLLGQSLIEHVFHFSANISVFINVGGGIYFLYLIIKNRR